MKIPRVMSTQHPDNVRIPFFAEHPDMSGDDEILEAYYAFSHLGCDEQMWDCEGKEVDVFVIRKLLTKYEHFFAKNVIGKDVFITLRTPNPTVEKEEAKVLLETLESIPRSFDTAKAFYKSAKPPIFEVILPMTTSARCLNRIYYYYRDFVAGKENQKFYKGDITIAEWIGKFRPGRINVIPLFEDKEHLLESHNILKEYLKDKDVSYQRVFLAYSDPAMNYGMISAMLLNKIALQRLRRLSEKIGKEIYPIIGIGSAPFRGNFQPATAEKLCFEFPDVQTFTVQSAYKYDHPASDVISSIRRLKQIPKRRGWDVDEERCMDIVQKISVEYARQVESLAPLINLIAGYVPRRRMRKLHIGLFGYARSVGKVTLPRVISFCAACYSIGLPPEILAFNVLDSDELAFLKGVFVNLGDAMREALRYLNEDVISIIPKGIRSKIRDAAARSKEVFFNKSDISHKAVTDKVIQSLKEKKTENLQGLIIEAAHIRRFLG